MAEIFKNKGTALVIAFLIMGVLMILGVYFLSFTLTEFRIAKSQTVGTQTYYLAEAGINEAIWKLKYDDVWSTCFVTSTDCGTRSDCNATWTASFTISTEALIPNSTTTVTIVSPECAKGDITSTSTIALSESKTVQRVVKTKVLRDLGSLTEDSPLFAGSPSGTTKIKNSIVNIYNGNMYVRNVLNMQTGSQLNVYDDPTTDTQEGKVLVVGNVQNPERINASSTCGANICDTTTTCQCTDTNVFQQACSPSADQCPPKEFDMPAIDWDAYYSKAKAAQDQEPSLCRVVKKVGETTTTLSTNCIFTEEEFEDLLDEVGSGGTLILEHQANGVATSTYYVTGSIRLGGGRHLEINGVLVADSTVYIGTWGNAYLFIKDPGLGIPSGFLTQGKMNFDKNFLSWYEEIDVEGLLYSKQEMDVDSVLHTFTVEGGIIARKFDVDSGQLNPLNIHLDNKRIQEGVWGGSNPPPGEPIEYSPIITVEYWEESY